MCVVGHRVIEACRRRLEDVDRNHPMTLGNATKVAMDMCEGKVL